MRFSKSLQGSKCAITMRPISIESTLLLFLLIQNFLGEVELTAKVKNQVPPYGQPLLKKGYGQITLQGNFPWNRV